MAAKLQPVRGTHDILPDENKKYRSIIQLMEMVAYRYGYGQISTPIFEFSEVFHRTLGDSSDVVGKETYNFTDRGGEEITLRPEFTASVVRSFISNGLQDKLPFKVFYHGPAFRYERPQKGRMRQFHQFGAEFLGSNEPLTDVEIIAMTCQMLRYLQLDKKVKLEINSLGDSISRKSYRNVLVEYFNDYKNSLSDDSKIRLEKNPLRILDSKDEGDKNIIKKSPKAHDYFNDESKEFFAYITESLHTLSIDYTVNSSLVRGLDYYSHTVFEFTTDLLGAQGTVLAGGRYDGLVKQMGGNDVAGIGFAAGIERLLALQEEVGVYEEMNVQRPIAVIPVDNAQEVTALRLACDLRLQNYYVELITGGNMGKKMKKADKIDSFMALLIGEEEVRDKTVTMKNLGTGSQEVMTMDKLGRFLQSYYHKMSYHQVRS
ncbi:MAG: histidine--tRNA ligase [Rickettsiales bacterium]